MLTTNERQRVTVNHNLIYGFLNKYGLDISDWYGDAAIGLCNAVHSYREGGVAFSTYAYKCMFNEVMCEVRKRSNKSAIPNDMLIYYETECSNDAGDTCTIMDQLASEADVERMALSKVSVDEILDKLDEKESTVIKMSYYGYNQNTIAKKFGCSQRMVSKIKARVAKKLAA